MADRNVTIREVVKKIYRTEGYLGFWKGVSPTMARSFVVNCVALPYFELMNDYFYYGTVGGERRQIISD